MVNELIIRCPYPPSIIDTESGRYVVPAWIEVPKTTTLEDVRRNWISTLPDTPEEIEHHHDSEHIVKGSNGITLYSVMIRNGMYSCNCAGYGFRRKCRHIEEVKNKLQK